MVALANTINLLGFLAIDRFSQRLAADLHTALFEEYLHRDYLFHARTNSASLFSRVIYDCRRLAVGIVHSALTLVTSALTCAVIVCTVVLVNPWVAVAAALLLGGGYLCAYRMARRRLARNGSEQTRNVIEQTCILNESLAGAREILLLGKQGYFRDRFRERCDSLRAMSAIRARLRRRRNTSRNHWPPPAWSAWRSGWGVTLREARGSPS